jgi:hypothetical protein
MQPDIITEARKISTAIRIIRKNAERVIGNVRLRAETKETELLAGTSSQVISVLVSAGLLSRDQAEAAQTINITPDLDEEPLTEVAAQ